MRHSYVRVMMLVALSMPLGACSSFLGIHFTRHAPKAVPASAPEPQVAVNQSIATDLGRQQLADGQTGLAIESFQRALASGEPVAPAVNGLGVAFARLGRFDLAQRFFQEAMATDPANTRYSDNFAKLMRSPALALRHDGDIAAALNAEQSETAAQPVKQASAVPQPGKLQRVSRAEVRIITAPPQAAPITRTAAAVDKRFQPIVRISLADSNSPPTQSAVRMKLPEPKPAASEAAPASATR